MSTITTTPPTFPLGIFRPYVESVDQAYLRLGDEDVAANHEAGRIVCAFPPVDEAIEHASANLGCAAVPVSKFEQAVGAN